MSDTPTFATVADHVRHLETAHQGAFERIPQSDGTVRVRLVKTTGDVMTGHGANTRLAVADLAARLEAFAAATRGSI